MSHIVERYISIIRTGMWPSEIPRYSWQGSVDETWQKYVGPNACEEVLTTLANMTFKEKRKRDRCMHFNNFVYMWEFEIFNHVFHKVGMTHDIQQRFKAFSNTMPQGVMTRCDIVRITPIRHRVTAVAKETAFSVAARDYWIGKEWLDFSGFVAPLKNLPAELETSGA